MLLGSLEMSTEEEQGRGLQGEGSIRPPVGLGLRAPTGTGLACGEGKRPLPGCVCDVCGEELN